MRHRRARIGGSAWQAPSQRGSALRASRLAPTSRCANDGRPVATSATPSGRRPQSRARRSRGGLPRLGSGQRTISAWWTRCCSGRRRTCRTRSASFASTFAGAFLLSHEHVEHHRLSLYTLIRESAPAFDALAAYTYSQNASLGRGWTLAACTWCSPRRATSHCSACGRRWGGSTWRRRPSGRPRGRRAELRIFGARPSRATPASSATAAARA